MESHTSIHSIRKFVDSLEPGTRVVWIANGTLGTVQSDKTILWDNGHQMTHSQMKDTHMLLIRNAAEKKLIQDAFARLTVCKKSGCTLLHWEGKGCNGDTTEEFCPLAIVPEPEIPSAVGRRRHHMKAARASVRHVLAS